MRKISELQAFYTPDNQNKYNEALSQLQHAVQVAKLAEQNFATDAQIAACLLHDIGHLIFDTDLTLEDRDDVHEVHGAIILSQFFGPEVFQPVRYHVEAKRYLCTIDSHYYNDLSPTSKQSLKLQGGRYQNTQQIKAFENKPYFKEAVQLSRFDDCGKTSENSNADFDHYLPLLNSLHAYAS
ncbi:HD domain-containing protein [Cocleimonas flava]|uniref:Putative HD phosphohydrolase n=1 Tax=Cocleimonas flava TaxID=634765 RepID=A0A4R1EW89_9GAMM|nr:HD domain-containing protein [Cocleimonas flava]TCJ85040.1 putative HD phosphohydrolase [Cocleimonas flava]